MTPAAKGAKPLEWPKQMPADGAPRENNHETPGPGESQRLDAGVVRGLFARSLCRAHQLVVGKQRAICDAGTPCARMSECLKLADSTLLYLEYRNRLPT